jgi:hypothetical protein
MSMSIYQRAVGMGFYDPVAEGGYPAGAAGNSSGGSSVWSQIPGLIAGFGNQFLQQWGNRGVAAAGVNPYASSLQTTGGLTQAQYAEQERLRALSNNSGGVGFGFDSQGLRLSDGSHIGWTTIAVVVGGFYLVQSPGFTKRR